MGSTYHSTNFRRKGNAILMHTRQPLTHCPKAAPVSSDNLIAHAVLTLLVTIFTPDTTHYPIALYAVERGIHVLVTKPAVKLLEHHQQLLEAARKNNVFVYVEVSFKLPCTYIQLLICCPKAP